MTGNRQTVVYDEHGNVRSVSRNLAESMGWSASRPDSAQGEDACEFCGAVLEPRQWGGVVCPGCGAEGRMFSSQNAG